MCLQEAHLLWILFIISAKQQQSHSVSRNTCLSCIVYMTLEFPGDYVQGKINDAKSL